MTGPIVRRIPMLWLVKTAISRRRLPPRPRHRRARHQRPQRRLRAQPLPLRTVLRQRRLARLLRARAQPRALDRPPRRRPPHSAAHRRGHHPQPAPHSAGPPRQPQRPPQAPPAVAVAMGHRLHQRTPTNPQPAPAHLSRPQRPAQRSPTPPATNPHRPRTPAPHAPTPTQHTRAPTPASTNPKTAPTLTAPVDSGLGWGEGVEECPAGDGLGADFGVIDARCCAGSLWCAGRLGPLRRGGGPASSSPRSLVRRASLQRGTAVSTGCQLQPSSSATSLVWRHNHPGVDRRLHL